MNKILIAIFLVLSSCQENNSTKENTNRCDSLLNKLNDIKETDFYKFQLLLEQETQTEKDTLLLNKYSNLKSNNNLLNLYISDRIKSIRNRVSKTDFLDEFSGEYFLKPNHSSKNSYANIIKINHDSCYIFKNNKLLVSRNFSLINSSNKFIKGRIIIDEYKMSFDGSLNRKILLLDNNKCMDCEQLQFIKSVK